MKYEEGYNQAIQDVIELMHSMYTLDKIDLNLQASLGIMRKFKLIDYRKRRSSSNE